MNNNLNNEILELSNLINNTNDELELIILNDIFEKKIKKIKHLIINKNNIKFLNINKKSDNLLDELIENNEKDIENEHIIKEQEYKKEQDIKDKKKFNKIVDPKFLNELKNDFSNNKLMERMNSELDYVNKKSKKKSHRVIIKPFSQEEEMNNNYTNINKFNKYSIPGDDFTSKRLLQHN